MDELSLMTDEDQKKILNFLRTIGYIHPRGLMDDLKSSSIVLMKDNIAQTLKLPYSQVSVGSRPLAELNPYDKTITIEGKNDSVYKDAIKIIQWARLEFNIDLNAEFDIDYEIDNPTIMIMVNLFPND